MNFVFNNLPLNCGLKTQKSIQILGACAQISRTRRKVSFSSSQVSIRTHRRILRKQRFVNRNVLIVVSERQQHRLVQSPNKSVFEHENVVSVEYIHETEIHCSEVKDLKLHFETVVEKLQSAQVFFQYSRRTKDFQLLELSVFHGPRQHQQLGACAGLPGDGDIQKQSVEGR